MITDFKLSEILKSKYLQLVSDIQSNEYKIHKFK